MLKKNMYEQGLISFYLKPLPATRPSDCCHILKNVGIIINAAICVRKFPW